MSSVPRYLLGITDYSLISSTFLICILIGYLSSRKKIKQSGDVVTEYLLGSRNMAVIPVALSMMATSQSAFSITGVIGEMYRYGLYYLFLQTALILANVLLAFCIIPVFHMKKYTSIYEFLELRYDQTLRKLVSAVYIIQSCLYAGVCLYLPCISIGAVSSLPYWSIVLFGGIICTFYSALGGFRAVIWTDVFQALVMFGTMALMVGFGVSYNGGVSQTWAKAFNETEAERIILYETPTTRYSVWGLIFAGFTYSVMMNVGNQAAAQRILAVKNKRFAVMSFLLHNLMMLLLKLLLALFAIVVIAAFSKCDPIKVSKNTGVKRDDQIFIYAATQFMGEYPGMVGLSLIAVISASLSTISSYLNSMAAITLEDFLKPTFPNFFSSEARNIITCKALTGIFGAICILTSFLVPHMGGAVKFGLSIISSITCPGTAIILVGMISRKVNSKACKVAYAGGILLGILLCAGTFSSNVIEDTLPHNTESCEFDISNDTIVFNNNTELGNSTNSEFNNEDIRWYRISIIWFGPIGLSTTIFLAIFLSYLIGEDKVLNEDLLSQFLHRTTKGRKVPNKANRASSTEVISNEISLEEMPLKI